MEIVLVIMLAVYTFFLSRRVSVLEEKLDKQKSFQPSAFSAPIPPPVSPIPPSPTQNIAISPIPVPPQPVSVIPPAPPSQTTPEASGGLIAWVKEDFFVKLGALLLLLAFGWFVSYAFTNNWIGPVGKILSGVLSGYAVLAFGTYRLKAYRHQGSIFVVLGSVVIIMSIWAGREIYDFLHPLLALVCMAVPIIITASLSLHHRLPSLASSSLLMGALAPLFTGSVEPNFIGLSLYLLVLIIGTLWIAYRIDAPYLTAVGLGVVSFWSMLLSVEASETEEMYGLLFALIFTVIFFVSNCLSLVRHHNDTVGAHHIVTGLGSGLYFYLWIVTAASGTLETILYAASTALFTLGGLFIFERTKNPAALYIYGSVGLGYLIVLTASLFSGTTLTMVYAAQLAALLVATRYLPVEAVVKHVLAGLYLPLALLSLEHVFASSWQTGILHSDFVALCVVALSLGISGLALRRDTEAVKEAGTLLLIASSIYGFLVYGLSLFAVLSDNVAAPIFLMTMSGLSVVMYTTAVRLQYETLQAYAAILSLSYVFLFVYSFEYIFSAEWQWGIMHLDAVFLTAIVANLWLSSLLLLKRELYEASKTLAQVLVSAAGVYSLTLIWLVCQALFTDGVGTAVSLTIFTLTGLGLFLIGQTNESKFVRIWGGAILCGVVLRLLFVEVWQLSIALRIITFVIVGLLLISTAFLGKKHKDTIQ